MPACIVNNRSTLYKTAVELYTRHRPDAGGWCSQCERLNCPARACAADVIWAAGADPVLTDSPPRRPVSAGWYEQATEVLPTTQGGSGSFM
jgi:hypothetical protein